MVAKSVFRISNGLLRFEMQFQNHGKLLIVAKQDFTTMAKKKSPIPYKESGSSCIQTYLIKEAASSSTITVTLGCLIKMVDGISSVASLAVTKSFTA